MKRGSSTVIETPSQKQKTLPMKWGIEFETRLIINDDKRLKNKNPIWTNGKQMITSEVVDINRNIHDGKIEECPAKHECLFNLEAIFGVYEGNTIEFSKDFNDLQKKFMESFANHKIVTDDKTEYDMFNVVLGSDTCQNLFKNNPYPDSRVEGCYDSKIKDKFAGYTKLDPDEKLTGTPQMTTTFKLEYLPNLFKMFAIQIGKSPLDFMTFYLYQMSYNIALLLVKDIDKDEHYLTTFGFMIYVVYYCLVICEQGHGPEVYLKSYFPIKPRTNIGILYSKVSEKCKHNIRLIQSVVNAQEYEDKKYFYPVYIKTILHSLVHPEPRKPVYYIENHPNYPSNFHTLGTGFKLKNFEKIGAVVTEVPFYYCDPAPDNCKNPDISYPKHHVEIWEWMTEDDSISVEFRKFDDLTRVCLRTYNKGTAAYKFLADVIYNDRFLYKDLDRTVKYLFTNVFRPMFDITIEEHLETLEYVSEKEFILKIDDIEYTEAYYRDRFIDKYKMTYEQLVTKIKGLEQDILV